MNELLTNSFYCENITELIEQYGSLGRIYQVFGLPLTGKSTFLAKLVLEIAKKHIQNSQENNIFRFYICCTPGETLLWQSTLIGYFEGLAAETKRSHPWSTCVFSIKVVKINSSDDLLRSLTFIQSTELHSDRANAFIIVDSLNFIWQELLMVKKSKHDIHWYYLNLIHHLRSLTNKTHNNTSSGSRTFTVFFTNGCQGYASDESVLKLPFNYYPALGVDSLEKEVDYNLYVEYVHKKDNNNKKNKIIRHQQVTAIKTGRNTSFLLPLDNAMNHSLLRTPTSAEIRK